MQQKEWQAGLERFRTEQASRSPLRKAWDAAEDYKLQSFLVVVILLLFGLNVAMRVEVNDMTTRQQKQTEVR